MTNTQLTQMALSAILRCREQIDLFDLTSVLCGRSQRDIKERGFDRIKTYGAGKAYSIRQWHYMLIQMIQQEYFIIDYEEQYHLKVTEKGQRVLKGEMEVSELKVGVPAHSIFSKNNVKIQIDEDILEAVDWRKLLAEIRRIVEDLRKRNMPDPRLDTEGKAALYGTCGHDIDFTLLLYDVIKRNAKFNFRNNNMRKLMLLNAITEAIIEHQKAGKINPEEILSIVVANDEF